MRPRIPRQPTGDLTRQPTGDGPRPSIDDQADARADATAGLGAELSAVLAGARRRALRDGDRQIDTAHVLHSLLEHDPEVRDVFEDGTQVARLLGYLVQRSIGYGLRWQSTVEDSGTVPVVSVAEGLSPLASAALEQARLRAARFGEERACCVDLLAAVVADPQARAVEVLTRAGVDARELFLRIESRPRRPEEYADSGEPAP
ncbi:Clp protease N-terminal domain-containing protein [Streptomyces sp. NPDC053367]|uniref:Clp protease N-terminal domain-containing protein n=1 Tax=Streptomyces sp. NPDC053367 TaxID=3365700 RepID=UPI0037CEE24E